MKPLVSLGDLARKLRTPLATLRAAARNVKIHYHSWNELNEKTNKVRTFRAPNADLMRIQRMININVLGAFQTDNSVHGGVKGRSPRTNATQHLGQSVVVTLDVRSFFPSVRHGMVYRMFRHELGFGRDVARLLTRLTTLDAQLPQGAPTSPTIANLLLSATVDFRVSAQARLSRVTNTRFVDDFGFSGGDPRSMINDTAKALSQKRLPIWRKASKLRIMPRSGPQVVTGLHVNSSAGPSVPRKYRNEVRAAIHNLKQMPSGTQRDDAIASIRGRIRYVAGFNPGSARRLLASLDAKSTNT